LLSNARMRVVAFLLLGLAACSGTVDTTSASASAEGELTSEERRTMGSFFLVEQPSTESTQRMRELMASGPPGGLCFWNPGHVGGVTAREVIRGYSQLAAAAGSPPVLFSADYEGGALSLAPTGKNIPGIQRYVADMTALAHPRWIGRAHRQDLELGKELARLHGYIMARELRSIGINYPLGTVSDLAQHLFSVRGLDADSDRVATLIGEVVSGALSVDHMVFVTKHFPGLGLTTSDTHDDIVVAPLYDEDTAASVIEPFRSAINASVRLAADARLSVLASHAKFPSWDPELNTTVSPAILGSLLREDLGFSGIAVSDAMWMGPYGRMTTAQVLRVYVQTFLAGMDLLMIPNVKYEAALGYFRKLGDDQLSSDEKAALSAQVGLGYSDLRAKFLARTVESRARLDATRDAIGHAHLWMDPSTTVPSTTTTAERARYHQILKQLDARLP
jgi:beta-N-acetylhexosaminidase